MQSESYTQCNAPCVKNGGHHIPDDVVERRYYRSIQNLISLYLPIADQWDVFDNSSKNPKQIAYKKEHENMPHILNESAWQLLKDHQHEE